MPSVAVNIRNAVVTVIQGLGLAGLTNANVVKRKRPVWRSGDAEPLIVVSGTTIDAQPLHAEDVDDVQYGIAVTIIDPNQGKLIPADTLDDFRETIRKALTKPNPLPTVPQVSNVKQRDKQWFNPSGLDKNYDYVPLAFIVETHESQAA